MNSRYVKPTLAVLLVLGVSFVVGVGLAAAAVLTAAALPEDGHSPASVIAIAAGWAATAGLYLRSSRRTTTAIR